MFQTWRINSSLKSFPVFDFRKSKHTFRGRFKIKFVKLNPSNNLLLAQQNRNFNIPEDSILFLNVIFKKQLKSFPWRVMNIKKTFISKKFWGNLEETTSNTKLLFNSSDSFARCFLNFLSLTNECNIDYKTEETKQSIVFFKTELNKTFETRNACNYNATKRCEAVHKNGSKTNYISLFNKEIPFYGTCFWHNSYSSKNYSKNVQELEGKQTKELFKKQSEQSEAKYPEKQWISKEKLKAAVRDYGATILIFHVIISLISLGVCYLVVVSGFDYSRNVEIIESAGTVETAAKFVVAYAIHKTLAPARIGITVTIAPFIVKKLRKIGILKPSKS